MFVPSSHGFEGSVAVDVDNLHSQQITKGHFRLFGFVEHDDVPGVVSPAETNLPFTPFFWDMTPRRWTVGPTSVEKRRRFHFQGPRCQNIISFRNEAFGFLKMRGIS
jgi:hypothetical protein